MQYYFLFFNLITFFMFGYDKRAAIDHRWRISEKALLSLSILGGAFGALLGMLTFHHKTRKSYFWIICSIAAVVHAFIFLR